MYIVINANLDSVPEDSIPMTGQGNFYHNLLCSLGYPSSHPPVADLLRHYHDLQGQWLVVSPIHWQATHNDAMIVASDRELELSDSESRLWFAAFAEFIVPDKMNLHYYDAQTWLLQCDHLPPISAKPVHTLVQQSLTSQLLQLDDTLFWQRFITECQMFFSAHPLNKTRTACPINGLWFWGNGTLGEKAQKTLVSDDSLHDLAALLSTRVRSYSSSESYTKDSVLLFQDINPEELHTLQSKLQKYTVHWYWNNLAYDSKPKGWLSRLWR